MRGARLESELEELGVLRSFSSQGFQTTTPTQEVPVPNAQSTRPDYPRRPCASKDEPSSWVAAFVGWYNHWHRHSAIKFVTPIQASQRSPSTILQEAADILREAPVGPIPTLEPKPHPIAGVKPEEVWINKATRKAKTDPGATISEGSLNSRQGGNFLEKSRPPAINSRSDQL